MSKETIFKKDQKRSKKLAAHLETLFDFVPPQRLSRKLRTIFLTYLKHEKDLLPLEIDETIMEMEWLMEFLDEAGDGRKKLSNKPEIH